MAIQFTLYRNANRSNQLNGAYPLGNAPAIVGVTGVAVGASTITITGLGFGTKAQAAPVLWDNGTEVYENGVKNTYRESKTDGYVVLDIPLDTNELYDNTATIKLNTTSRPLRYTGSGGHYVNTAVNGQGFIEGPAAAGGKGVSVPEHNHHYTAWWIKYHYDFQELHSFEYTGKVGTFTVPDLATTPDAIGEAVTLNNAVTAYILRDTGTDVSIYTPGYRLRMNELANTTITGNSSGASLTVVDKGGYTDDHSGPEKICRIWSEPDGLSGFRSTWQRSINQVGSITDSYGDINLAPYAVPQQWAFMEVMVDIPNEVLKVACNGDILSTVDFTGYLGQGDVWDKTNGLYIAEIGLQPIRILNQLVEFGEICIQHEFRRVYIGDAATWGACTKYEIARTLAWTDDEILVDKNLGGLPDIATTPAYIYVVDTIYPADSDAGFEFGGV